MPKKIVTKQAWINLGYDYFSKGGEKALVIEKMARDLRISKTSFYNFFGNRVNFLGKIIEFWQQLRTQELIDLSCNISSAGSTTYSMMLALFSTEIKDDFLFYLRQKAQTDANIKLMIDAIESKRIVFAAQQIEKTGTLPEDALEKATLIYVYYLGWWARQPVGRIVPDEAKKQISLLVKQLNLKVSSQKIAGDDLKHLF